jgi:hypothetical protein
MRPWVYFLIVGALFLSHDARWLRFARNGSWTPSSSGRQSSNRSARSGLRHDDRHGYRRDERPSRHGFLLLLGSVPVHLRNLEHHHG